MNITKLSGSIFMVFVLISAPFFAIQTKQDGINRVLANEFRINSIIDSGVLIPYSLTFVSSERWVWENTTPTLSFSPAFTNSLRTNIINNSLHIENINELNILLFWDSNINYLGFYASEPSVEFASIVQNSVMFLGYISDNSTNGFIDLPNGATSFAWSASQESTVVSPNISWQDAQDNKYSYEILTTSAITQTYYEIFENARLANYSDVDGFTNIFYQIPRMANGIANAYNRFINFTDNLNPFRIRDESTGEFRDQTPSEVMDSWPARIISWFRRFTD